jgi:Lipid A 3-O-deacylase (PagL)
MIRRLWATALIAATVVTATTRGQESPDAPFVLPATTLTVADEPAYFARGQAADSPVAGVDGWFQTGVNSTQVLGGAYASGAPGPRSRQFNYAPFSIRQSVMMTNPEDHWWGRTNMEALLDLTGASIWSSYGSYFVGGTLFARKNWVEPGANVIPYSQLGVGIIYNDVSKDQSQHALGLPLEFYLHAEVGLKYFVKPNLSLDIEGGLQHISNGKLGERNYGVNCYGGAVGFTYYLPIGG